MISNISTALASIITMNDAATKDGSSPEQSVGDALLKWLDLSQSQVAALLGVSPQAVSKAIKDEGIGFFGKEHRAQRLYSAMLFIGGDRYALTVTRLKELASQLNYGLNEEVVNNNVRATELYASANEIWVISDNPGRVVDWDAMKDILYSESKTESKVVVFFLSTLEGAENWAEALEREAIRPAIQEGHVLPGKGRQYGAYVFVVVSNMTTFSGEYVISNPGSRCMGMVASTKTMGVHYWNGSSYSSANPNSIKGFVQAVQRNELGMGPVKAHFFPTGDKITSELFDFRPKFIDGLIGKLGNEAVGGILRDVSGREENTIKFNDRRKYNPAFLLTYKRKPKDSFSELRTKSILEHELIQQQNKDENSSQTTANW